MNNAWWTKLLCVLGVLAAVALPRGASAQSVAYLRMDGLTGDVTAQPFAGQSVVESFNFVETMPTSSAARPVVQPVKMRLQVTTVLVDFLRVLESSTVIKTATLSFVKPGERAPFVFQEVAFDNVRVVGYRMAWSDGVTRPSLELEITYQSARWTATSQSSTGAPAGSNSYVSSTVPTR